MFGKNFNIEVPQKTKLSLNHDNFYIKSPKNKYELT